MVKTLRILCLILGLLLIAAALCLVGWNLWQERSAEENSSPALAELEKMTELRKQAQEQEAEEEAAEPNSDPRPRYEKTPEMEMPLVTYEQREYIGTLYIPALGLTLPILSQWDYAGLRIAPCRYYGSAYTDSLVIAGHNYNCHFGRLKNLSEGDSIVFTDADGNEFVYEVALVEVLEPQAVEEMLEGGWALTLFTCTLGGKSRVTVRCTRAE